MPDSCMHMFEKLTCDLICFLAGEHPFLSSLFALWSEKASSLQLQVERVLLKGKLRGFGDTLSFCSKVRKSTTLLAAGSLAGGAQLIPAPGDSQRTTDTYTKSSESTSGL